MRGKAVLTAIAGIALAVGVPFVLGGPASFSAIREFAPEMIITLAGLAMAAGVAKAGKMYILWRQLGDEPSFLRILAISLAGDFAFLSTPAGAGGYVVTGALLNRAGASWSKATTMVAGEQALDLLFFAVAVPLAALSALEPVMLVMGKVPTQVYLIAGSAALLVGGALWYGRRRVAQAARALLPDRPMFQAGSERVAHFFREIRSQTVLLLRADPVQGVALLLLTSLQWFARYGALWVVVGELGHKLPLGFILVLQAGLLHLAQWTGIPAGGGGADLGLSAALAPWLSARELAVVLLQWRFSTLYLPLLLGALALAGLGMVRSRAPGSVEARPQEG